MFRAAVLAIVFAFAAAPEATLLCRLWCPHDTSAGRCQEHGQASSIRLNPNDVCDTADANVVAVAREDSRRTTPSGAGHVIAGERYQIVRPIHGARTVERWAREHARENRPLETTLRL